MNVCQHHFVTTYDVPSCIDPRLLHASLQDQCQSCQSGVEATWIRANTDDAVNTFNARSPGSKALSYASFLLMLGMASDPQGGAASAALVWTMGHECSCQKIEKIIRVELCMPDRGLPRTVWLHVGKFLTNDSSWRCGVSAGSMNYILYNSECIYSRSRCRIQGILPHPAKY
jgi:hypothetical protein